MQCLKQEHRSGRQGSASPAMVTGKHITTFGLFSLWPTKHFCVPYYQLMGCNERENVTSISEDESRRWIIIMTSLATCHSSSNLLFLRHKLHLHWILRYLSLSLSPLCLCACIKGERISCHFNAEVLGMAMRWKESHVCLSPKIISSSLHFIVMARG